MQSKGKTLHWQEVKLSLAHPKGSAELKFGAQGTYLLDFYHACEYLAAAASACSDNVPENWLTQQKQRLKQSDTATVMDQLNTLMKHPIPDTDETDNPVQKAYGYLNKRIDQLDYQQAIDNELPIGSGEIESAHRHVVQERMKLPGAWWNAANVEAIMALRVEQNNGGWEAYWQQQRKMSEAA